MGLFWTIVVWPCLTIFDLKTLTARALGNFGMLLLQTNIYIYIYIYIYLCVYSLISRPTQTLSVSADYRWSTKQSTVMFLVDFCSFEVYQQPSNWRSSSRTKIRMCFLCSAPKMPGDEVPINFECCFTQLHEQIAVYSLFFSMWVSSGSWHQAPKETPKEAPKFHDEDEAFCGGKLLTLMFN